MKTTLLSLLLLILFFSMACDDDPISNDDDKLVETLEDYRIAYSTVDNTNSSIVQTCDIYGNNNQILFENAAIWFAPVDSIVYIQRSEEKTIAYNFYNKKIVYTFEDEEISSFWALKIPGKDKVFMGPKSIERFKPVYIANLDGTGKSIFSENSPGISISFSPDQEKMLLEDELEYKVCNTDGTNKKFIKDLNSINSLDWGADSRHLFWSRPMDVNITNIELLDIETGTSKKLITLDDGVYGVTKISPDGKKIVFYDKKNNLFMMNADGSDLQTLRTGGKEIKGDRFVYILEWAPDSRHLLSSKVLDFENSHIGGALEVIDTKTGESTIIHNDDTVISAYWVKVK